MTTSEKRETSALLIKDKVSSEFSWDFRIPPRSRIKQNMSEIAGHGGFVFTDLKFSTGFLADVYHKLIFAIYANQINAYVLLPTKNHQKKITITKPARLELVSENVVKCTKELKFNSEDMSNAPTPHCIFGTMWTNLDNSWDDTIDLMRFVIDVECEECGTPIAYINADISAKLKPQPPPLELNASDIFLQPELSDVQIVCGSREFPAHKFLLACKSSVFRTMFQHDMLETKEGRVLIEDISPETMEEMLRFLYCGETNNLHDRAHDLFIAADKYNLQVLKRHCEVHLLKNITRDNALDLFVLGDSFDGSVLKARALEVLKRYKTTIFSDAETFQEFTTKYPELTFELYKN